MNKNKEIPPERIARIKTLIFYVCAHRVERYYGTLDNLLKSMAKLKRWSRYSRGQKNLYKNSWADIAKERDKFDACFSIPSGLIKDILGRGRDDDGKQFRYSPTQMIKQLGGFLQRVCKHGHKFAPDHDGKFTIVTGSWGTKYMLNKQLFYKLWTDDAMKRYFRLETLGDKKLQKLIVKYFKKADKPDEKTTPKTQEDNKMNDYDQPVYAANVPDEDAAEIEETQPLWERPKATQPQPTEQPKTTQQQQQLQPMTRQALPVYADAMHDIDIELHAMRDAKTRDELKAAAVRVNALLKKYAPIWPERCEKKIQDARYYIDQFKRRTAA